MSDEEALISQVLAGDMLAFRLLIRKHERLVAHMIGRVVKSEQDLEELCQDVFLKVFEKLKDFNFQSRLSTWIATIAYRHAINHARKQKMAFADFPEEHALTSQLIEAANPETEMEEANLDEAVLKLVELLPPQYRMMLTMYHVEGMTYPEICVATGMPEGTVKNYLFRGRALIKEKVKLYLGKEELR